MTYNHEEHNEYDQPTDEYGVPTNIHRGEPSFKRKVNNVDNIFLEMACHIKKMRKRFGNRFGSLIGVATIVTVCPLIAINIYYQVLLDILGVGRYKP